MSESRFGEVAPELNTAPNSAQPGKVSFVVLRRGADGVSWAALHVDGRVWPDGRAQLSADVEIGIGDLLYQANHPRPYRVARVELALNATDGHVYQRVQLESVSAHAGHAPPDAERTVP